VGCPEKRTLLNQHLEKGEGGERISDGSGVGVLKKGKMSFLLKNKYYFKPPLLSLLDHDVVHLTLPYCHCYPKYLGNYLTSTKLISGVIHKEMSLLIHVLSPWTEPL
jgi:hypothetical protein